MSSVDRRRGASSAGSASTRRVSGNPPAAGDLLGPRRVDHGYITSEEVILLAVAVAAVLLSLWLLLQLHQ